MQSSRLVHSLGHVLGQAAGPCSALASQAMVCSTSGRAWEGFSSMRRFSTEQEVEEPFDPKSPGERYGKRLLRQDPEKYRRMRALLGYYNMPTSNKGDEPRIDSVNINMLQTLKYLNLKDELKQRLLHYRMVALNRDVELMHGKTRSFLAQLKAVDKKPALPAFMQGLAAKAKE